MASNEREMKDTGNQIPDAIAAIARCWWYPDAQLEEALDNGLFKEELYRFKENTCAFRRRMNPTIHYTNHRSMAVLTFQNPALFRRVNSGL